MTTPIPFGQFLLAERVAIGGMAEVWAAVRRGEPGRAYAVKRMLPTLAEDRELVRMFLEEARLVARLDHPGIVPVHELGTRGGGWYMAMDWVAGRDLRALGGGVHRRGGTMPVALAAHVAARAADALDHAHRAAGADGRPLGIVHRDVSPANVLLGFDGRVRVIDFGLARAERRRPAGGPVLRGKLSYMSPEAVRGLAVDRRSDVFALGAVLHELLAGARLFTGPDARAVMEKVRVASVAPPSRANAAVPPELDRIVLRALAREPEERFASARALRDALLPVAGPGGGDAALARFMAAAFPEELREEEARRVRLRAAGLG